MSCRMGLPGLRIFYFLIICNLMLMSVLRWIAPHLVILFYRNLMVIWNI